MVQIPIVAYQVLLPQEEEEEEGVHPIIVLLCHHLVEEDHLLLIQVDVIGNVIQDIVLDLEELIA